MNWRVKTFSSTQTQGSSWGPKAAPPTFPLIKGAWYTFPGRPPQAPHLLTQEVIWPGC